MVAPVEEIDAVIIGTGPSGLLASALLAGRDAYLETGEAWRSASANLDPELKRRLGILLGHRLGKEPLRLGSLDWFALGNGLKGRTNSVVSTVVDLLHMPGAEKSIECEGAISLRPDAEAFVPHVIVGPKPGGMWREMRGDWTTLSPGFWMALPGLTVREFRTLYPQDAGALFDTESRMPRNAFLSYLEAYAEHMGLKKHLVEGVATSVQRDGGALLVDVTIAPGLQRRFRASAVILATGSYALPRRIGVSGENLQFVHHRSSSWQGPPGNRVLVVGAGLSAADLLLELFKQPEVGMIHHSFRSDGASTKIGSMFHGETSGMYSEYGRLVALMLGELRIPTYTPQPGTELVHIAETGDCTLKDERDFERTIRVDVVYVLVGTSPDLSFVEPGELQKATLHPRCDTLTNGKPNTHPVFVDVDKSSMEVDMLGHSGLYALGPLRGANFVRFLVGDAFGMAWSLRGKCKTK